MLCFGPTPSECLPSASNLAESDSLRVTQAGDNKYPTLRSGYEFGLGGHAAASALLIAVGRVRRHYAALNFLELRNALRVMAFAAERELSSRRGLPRCRRALAPSNSHQQ